MSRRAYRRHPEALGYLHRTSIYTTLDDFRRPHDFRWSGELIHRLNLLVDNYDLEWRYHSTWWKDVDRLNTGLQAQAIGSLVWDAETGVTKDNYFEVRGSRKYEALLNHVNHHQRPFIWTDDEATFYYKKEDFVVPHLVLPVTSEYGLLRSHIERIESFVKTYAAHR